jgi:hypothetical protein
MIGGHPQVSISHGRYAVHGEDSGQLDSGDVESARATHADPHLPERFVRAVVDVEQRNGHPRWRNVGEIPYARDLKRKELGNDPRTRPSSHIAS